jgi:TonB-dependent starch-binding outer membrane protein SusC
MRILFTISLLVSVFASSIVAGQDSLIISPREILSDTAFNQGNIQNFFQSIQSRFAGILIARPGSNPNADFEVRVRGISSVVGRVNPLVVVDGMPILNLQSIDPDDIESIEVLKGSETAQFGMQGASGVVLIRTKRGGDQRFWAQYNGYVSLEKLKQKQFVLDRNTFVENEGADIGGDTNWMSAITREALGMNHQISLGGTSGPWRLRGSLSYRDFDGIQKQSGFKRLTGLIGVDGKLLKDKLILSYTGGFGSVNANHGIASAFKQAMQVIPTLPIQTNTGSFIEPNLFDQFNPMAMIMENTLDESTRNHRHSLNTRFAFRTVYFEVYSGIKRVSKRGTQTSRSNQL